MRARPIRFPVRWLLAAALLSGQATAATATADAADQEAPTPAETVVELAEPVAEPEDYAWVTPTTLDRIGRVMAPVFVNGKGPFRFIIDTGASSSAIAPGVSAALGLEPDETRPISLRGVTGAQQVPSIFVDSLEAGEIRMEGKRMPVIDPGVFADADGILGVEGFENACLIASFRDESVSILRGGCPMFRRGWPKVRADMRFGRLMVVKAKISRTWVHAIVDTGAERSLGNRALLEALELEHGAEDPTRATQVFGATEHTADGSLIPAPRIYLGDVNIADVHVTFGDFDVFRLWDLDSEPAILLGMDVLGVVDALMIDYRRGELRFRLLGSSDSDNIEMRSPPFGRLP